MPSLTRWMSGSISAIAYSTFMRADDVVDLGVDGVLAVHHRVRRGSLLGEVHDRVRAEVADHVVGEVGVGQVADVAPDLLPGQLVPDPDPGLQGLDRHQAVDAHLEVVAAPGEVVDHGHVDGRPRTGAGPSASRGSRRRRESRSSLSLLLPASDRRVVIRRSRGRRCGRDPACINHRTRGNNQCQATSKLRGGTTRSARPSGAFPRPAQPVPVLYTCPLTSMSSPAQQGHQCQS